FQLQNVRLEEPHRFINEVPVFSDNAEAAAMVDVEEGKIEGQQEKTFAIDDHHLAVITHQVFGRAGGTHAPRGQAPFELFDFFEIFFIRVGDQGMNGYAARGSFDERLLDFEPVQSVNNNFYAFLRLLDSLKQRFDTVARLNDDAHLKKKSCQG